MDVARRNFSLRLCSEESLPSDDMLDAPWPVSKFSKEERVLLKHKNVIVEEEVLVKPFPEHEAVFVISKRSSRWFLCDPKTSEIRRKWMQRYDQSEDMEQLKRQDAARLIQAMGLLLKVDQIVINTAIVFMHRYYIFHPIDMFVLEDTALVALHLACKLENSPRSCSDIFTVLHRVLSSQDSSKSPLDITPNQSEIDQFGILEDFMILTLASDLQVDHPSYFINQACKIFSIVNGQDTLFKAIHAIANESLKTTTFCIRYPPILIAAFSIFLASELAGYKIPESRDGNPWYYFVDKNITLEMLETLKQEFFYMEQKKSKPSEVFESSIKEDQQEKIPAQKRRMVKYNVNHGKRSCLSDTESLPSNDGEEDNNTTERHNRFTCERPAQQINVHLMKPKTSLVPQSFSFPQIQNNQVAVSQNRPFKRSFQPSLKCTEFLPSGSHAEGSSSTDTWLTSFSVVQDQPKFIRSTVPLKIHPIKKETKSDIKHNDMNLIIEDSKSFQTVMPAKQRISHYKRQSVEEPYILNIGKTIEIYDSSDEDSSKSVGSSLKSLVRDDSGIASPNKRRKKDSKRKRSKDKKSKDEKRKKKKHHSKRLICVDDDYPVVKYENPIKLVLKKSVVNGTEQYSIKN